MNIFEVERVGSVLRDVLQNTIDVMEGMTSICIVFAEFLSVYHLEVWFNCGVSMDPDVDKGVRFLDRVLPQSWG